MAVAVSSSRSAILTHRFYHRASFVIVMWCAIGLLQMQIPWYPSRPQVRGFIVSHLWAFSTGLMVGITVTLLLSGAFSKRYDRSP